MTKQRFLTHRCCSVEALEARQLLTVFYPLSEPGVELAAAQWASQVLSSHERQQYRDTLAESPHIRKFVSATDAQDAVSELASDFWSELFGQELTRELWEQNRIAVDFAPWRADFLPTQDLLSGTEIVFAAAATDTPQGVQDSVPTTAPPAEYDRTNVQVEGVDEHDLVEFSADGFMFVAADRHIQILDVSDLTNITQVNTLEQDSQYLKGLYSLGDRLIAVSTNSVHIYDVTDKSAPSLISVFEVSGNIQATRMTAGSLVLISEDAAAIPRPAFLPADDLPSDSTVTLGADSIGRFETETEYLARVASSIVQELTPQVSENSQPIDPVDAWQDLVLSQSSLGGIGTTVTVIDVDVEQPVVVDTETVLGLHASVIYSDADSVYIVEQASQFATLQLAEDPQAAIYRLSLNDPVHNVVADAVGEVYGRIRNSRMMDEYAGDLRVVTDGIGAEGARSTNVFVLKPEDGKLVQIGSLEDLADGQAVFAAHFSGPRAMLTTAEWEIPWPRFDPLHGIDLSDPTQPVELSELVIPGVSTHLQWIDSDHLVGVGYFEAEEGIWKRQVSLYSVADLAAPEVIENWVSDYRVNPDFWGWNYNPLIFQFDSQTGTLLMPEQESIFRPWLVEGNQSSNSISPFLPTANPNQGVLVFNVDPAQPQSALTHVGTVANDQALRRSYLVEERILAISRDSLIAAPLKSPSESSEITFETPDLPGPAIYPTDEQSESSVAESDAAGNRLSKEVAATAGATDVNGDGLTSALDVLLIVNYLNNRSNTRAASTQSLEPESSPPAELDVSGDGLVTALDVLRVVNVLNAERRAEAESAFTTEPLTALATDVVLKIRPAEASSLTGDNLAAAHAASWAENRRR